MNRKKLKHLLPEMKVTPSELNERELNYRERAEILLDPNLNFKLSGLTPVYVIGLKRGPVPHEENTFLWYGKNADMRGRAFDIDSVELGDIQFYRTLNPGRTRTTLQKV